MNTIVKTVIFLAVLAVPHSFCIAQTDPVSAPGVELNESAITGYRIVSRAPRTIEIEVDYYYNGSRKGRPWLEAKATNKIKRISGDGISGMPVLVSPGKGTAKLLLKRSGYGPSKTSQIELRMWFTMLDVVATATFEENLTWHLEGENEISDLRVVSITDNHLEVEVEYFYNDFSSGTPSLDVTSNLEGERNQKVTVTAIPVDVMPGRNTGKFKLWRAFPLTEWARATQIHVVMNENNGKSIVDKKFDVKADWPAIDPLLSDGNAARADTETLYKRAVHYIDLGSNHGLGNAKHILDQIVLDDPTFVPAYAELARYHMKTNWNKQGLAQAERLLLGALDLDPEHANTLVLLGYVYAHQKRYQEATKTLTRAESIGTDNLWLHTNWGELLMMQGKADSAIARYLDTLKDKRTFDSNDRARLWAYKKLFKIYIDRADLTSADSLLGQEVSEFSEYPCRLGEYAEFKLTRMGSAQNAIELGSAALSKGCRRPEYVRKVLGASYFTSWAEALDANGETNTPEVISLYNKGQILFNDVPALYFYLSSNRTISGTIPHLKTKGLDINSVNARGMSALAMAIRDNNAIAVDRLLGFGADVNATIGSDQYTPLMFAIFVRDVSMVTRLVDAGADTNAHSRSGMTPVEFARQLGYSEIVELFLSGEV